MHLRGLLVIFVGIPANGSTHPRVFAKPYEICTLRRVYGLGLDNDGEVSTITPNLSKYVIFVSPLFFTIEHFLLLY